MPSQMGLLVHHRTWRDCNLDVSCHASIRWQILSVHLLQEGVNAETDLHFLTGGTSRSQVRCYDGSGALCLHRTV